jgi:hypothetical protein
VANRSREVPLSLTSPSLASSSSVILLSHVETSLHGRAVGIFFCIGGIGWTAIPILISLYAKRTSVQRAFLFASGSAVLLLALSILLTFHL